MKLTQWYIVTCSYVKGFLPKLSLSPSLPEHGQGWDFIRTRHYCKAKVGSTLGELTLLQGQGW